MVRVAYQSLIEREGDGVYRAPAAPAPPRGGRRSGVLWGRVTGQRRARWGWRRAASAARFIAFWDCCAIWKSRAAILFFTCDIK